MKLISFCRLIPALALLGTPGLQAGAPNAFPVDPAVSTNLVGSTLTLSLLIPGDQQPFGFQWSTGGTNLEGQQLSSLTLTSLQLGDGGTYTVTYTNLVDTNFLTYQSTATVYVVDYPVIYEPLGRTAVGAGVMFNVVATGGLLSYQWTWQGYDILGATGSTLSFSDIYAQASAGYYAVRVSNPLGTNTSENAILLTKPTPAGTYVGLFFNDDNAATESTGSFKYTISSSTRSFSGLMTLGTHRYRFAGKFDEAHTATNGPVLLSGDQVTASMQLITTNDTPQVAGWIWASNWVSGLKWTSTLRGTRLYFSSKYPTSLAGKYTLALLNTNLAPDLPNGHSYGSVVIRKDGSVTLSGRVADGTSISQSTGLSRLGQWPLHVSMNKESARLVGWLKIQKQSGGNIRGTNLYWIKDPVAKDKLYPGGFKLALQGLGSTFTPITNNTGSVLTSSNWIAAVYGGDLFDGNDIPTWITTRVWLRPPATFTAEASSENLKLSVSKSTGVIQGAFTDPANGRRATIGGVVLQQSNLGRGYFTSTNTAGAFALAPATPPQ
jgi:hypothetical protein